MKQDRVLLAHGFLFTAIAGWSFSPIFIRMLSDDFDVYTLSLARRSVAAAAEGDLVEEPHLRPQNQGEG